MGSKKDLLIEIGTEDLPAKILKKTLGQNFSNNIISGLRSSKLDFNLTASTIREDGSHRLLCTPRRLAVVIKDLSTKQEEQRHDKYGPAVSSAFDKDGNPTKAALGFAKSCGVGVDELEQGKQDKKLKLLYRENKPGKNTIELLPEIIEKAIKDLPAPKNMRWNQSDEAFIRPIRWLFVLFGSEVVNVNLFGITSKNVTYGHRFHSPKKIVVKHPSAYEELLELNGHVIVDYYKREKIISDKVGKLAKKNNGKPAYAPGLLEEITNLVEWPCALLGEFDTKFLDVHKELLISTMQDNQKYIPLLDNKDELLPKFIIVSNIDSKNPEIVKHGNEKVIVPRFEDAMFFWQRDKNIKLENNLEKLNSVVYEKQLGTLIDKTERTIQLATYLSEFTNADDKHSARAAELSKCDLVTETVGEFPKLQGIVGRNLALLNNEDTQVSTALEEQYLPKQAGGELPNSSVGITLALADRIDTLVGIFAIGKKPTGLKDPYGLRRASLAVLRIIIETPLDIDLRECLEKAASFFPSALQADKIVDEVSEYINDRYRAYFSDKGVPIDVIDSVLANQPTHPSDVAAKVAALVNFRKLPNADSLAAANKRIRNILKKIDRKKIGQVDSSLFKEDAENTLHAALEDLSSDVEGLFEEHEYEQALNKLANLRQPVDSFFDDVMVMDEDEKLKTNRIALLSRIDSLFMQVADFSRLQS